MKNMVKKNQIMITALAIMIAVAGYLNFAGTRITEEEIMTTGQTELPIRGRPTWKKIRKWRHCLKYPMRIWNRRSTERLKVWIRM